LFGTTDKLTALVEELDPFGRIAISRSVFLRASKYLERLGPENLVSDITAALTRAGSAAGEQMAVWAKSAGRKRRKRPQCMR